MHYNIIMKKGHITIIGSGVAGLTAAYLLSKKFKITLCESENRLGGHTNTITIDKGVDEGLAIDTGFIVCNEKNYPLFLKLLQQLNVPITNSDMSFGFHSIPRNFYYNSDLYNGIFAQRKHLFSPSFYRFLMEIKRFNEIATHDFTHNLIGEESLGEYIDKHCFSQTFISSYLLPMGAAIWSSPCQKMTDFPAKSFLQFWHNHCLLQVQDRPQWKTIPNGAKTYVDTIRKYLLKDKENQIYHTKVESVSRQESYCTVHTKEHGNINCDKVVIATHADQALKLLEKPSDDETNYLGSWRYSQNKTYLHTDNTLLPPKKRAWASWNVRQTSALSTQKPVSVSYYMNRLQPLQTKKDYFVSLNPEQGIAPGKLVKEIQYTHPCFDEKALDSQVKLPELNGKQNTYFCGSYFGYGFHEDAVRSAVNVADKLGIPL